MKKLLLALTICIFFATNAFSQIKFMNIPVKGSKASFELQLEKVGFVYHPDKECFRGTWNGRTVDLVVATNDGQVTQVQIYYFGYKRGIENLNTIKRDYNDLLQGYLQNKRYEAQSANLIRDRANDMEELINYNGGNAYQSVFNSKSFLSDGKVWFRVEQEMEDEYKFNILIVYDNGRSKTNRRGNSDL